MDINEAFPSAYLKAADLRGQTVTVTIADCKMELLGEDKKPVLYLANKDKAMVLNKTNSMALSSAFGPNTTNWVGQKIELFSMPVQFQGQIVDGLRVRVPVGAKQDFQAPAAQAKPAETPALDDDLPF